MTRRRKAKPVVLRIRPRRVGQFLGGGTYRLTVTCPRCGKPAWRKSRARFVHDATIELNAKNEPVLRVHASHFVREAAHD